MTRHLVFALCLVLAACAGRDFRTATETPFLAEPDPAGISVTFFGTTSFLVESDEGRILFDGYLSRARHALVRKIEPDPDRIRSILEAHRICGADAAATPECTTPGQRALDIVIPFHGHYDHAMDAALIAGWAGARTMRNASLDRLFLASRDFAEASGIVFVTDLEDNVPIADHLGPAAPPLAVGDMTLRLVETDHNENLISNRIAGETPAGFTFPSRIWQMGEGDNLTVLVEHEAGRILFVGSAGRIGSDLEGMAADVVFLSIGGLGSQTEQQRADYWHETVETTGAHRVFLTHWDNHQKPLPDPGRALSPTFFEPHSRVYSQLRDLAGDDVGLFFPPTRIAFDPFGDP